MLLVCTLPSAAQSPCYTYTTNDGGITITGYTCSDPVVTIPDTLDGLPVTRIGDSAFLGRLTSVTIPSSVTNIGRYAFGYCTALTNVTMASGLITIGDFAFASCSRLARVSIPDSVTAIGHSAFVQCGTLTQVTLGTGVVSIGSGAFRSCTNLTHILLPDSVATIGSSPFASCAHLLGITVSPGNPSYRDVDGVLFNASLTLLIQHPGGRAGPYDVPSTVTRLGSSAFAGSAGLTHVSIPSSVTSIGEFTFSSCPGLNNIDLPDTLISLGYSAFFDCGNLRSIRIPSRVNYVGPAAFGRCANLGSITVDPLNTSYSDVDGILFDKGQTTLLQCPGGRPGSYRVPDSVTTLANSAFADCRHLTDVTLGPNVTNLSYGLFLQCTHLARVAIPAGVTSIGSSAFEGCTHLADVTLPESVTSIGDNAFNSCSSLPSVTIPDGVANIDYYTFSSCTGLTNVTIGNGVTRLGEGAFSECSGLIHVALPNGVTQIGDFAFNGCSGLTHVPIPNSVTEIGNYAFLNCSSLSEVALPDRVTRLGDYAFNGCERLTRATIGNGLTRLGEWTFSSCLSLTNVTIGTGVTSLGDAAFAYCHELAGIYFQGNAPSLGSNVFDEDQGATVYYLAGATGWGPTFGGLPTEMVDGPTTGSCHPVADTSQPKLALSSAFDGVNYLVAIKGHTRSPEAVGAQLLSPTGARVGAFIDTRRDMDGPNNAPRVARGSTHYLMVWSDAATQHPFTGDDVYAQFITPGGELVGNALAISAAAGDAYALGVASDGTNFLAVWSDTAGFHGRLISAAGLPLGRELLFTTENVQEAGEVVYGGGQYLAVWMEGLDGAQASKGRFVSPSGQLGDVLSLSQDDSHFHNPVHAAYGADRFLVVWHHNTGENPGWDLRGRVVLTNGSLSGSELTLTSGPEDDIAWANAVVFDGQQFLVVWTSAQDPFPSPNCVVLGQHWSLDGTAASSPFTIEDKPGLKLGLGLSRGDGQVLVLLNNLASDVCARFLSPSNPTVPGAFPIATTGAFESGFETAFDGTNYLVATLGGPLAEGPITAQLISPTGTRVGSPVSLGESGGMPDVAFSGTNYFMVWAGSSASPGVRGQFIGRDGELVGPVLRISPSSSGTPRATSLAFAAGKYLACWSDDGSIHGQFVTPGGQLDGGSLLVSGTVPQAREQAIGFDGSNFLVVFNGGGDLRPNIYGQFVNPTGALQGGTLLVDANADPSDNPMAIAFDGANYLVVFNDQVGGVETGSMHVFARMVSPSGMVLPQRLTIADKPGAQLFPFVDFDGSSYLVSWSEMTSPTNLNLTLRFFDRAGQPLGPEFSPFAGQGTNAPAFGAPLFDGERYLVTAVLASFKGELTDGLQAASGDVYGQFLPRPARLDILPSPEPDKASLLLTGSPGFNYTIQMTLNPAAPVWTALVTRAPTNGVFMFNDEYATNSSRFYRAVNQAGF